MKNNLKQDNIEIFKDYFLNDVEEFINKTIKDLKNKSIYNPIPYLNKSSVEDLYSLCRIIDMNYGNSRHRTNLSNLLKEKESSMLEELKFLLKDLPLEIQIRDRREFVFKFKHEIVGILSISCDNLNIIPITIESDEYENISFKYWIEGFLRIPKIQIFSKKSIFKTKISCLTTDFGENLNSQLKTIEYERDKCIKQKERILKNKEKSLRKKLFFFFYKKRLIKIYNIIIESLNKEIVELKKFIQYVKNIEMSKNEFSDFLKIQNDLYSILKKELNI